jgi:hypothetical protein
VEWVNLKTISQYAYLIKKRNDGNFDIFSYSKNFILENTTHIPITYYITKEESQNPKIRTVLIDNLQFNDYNLLNGYISLNITIPPFEKRQITIEYQNNFDPSHFDISKVNFSVSIIRHLSDFRDNVLSKIKISSYFIDLYYDHNLYKIGLEGTLFLILLLSITLIVVFLKNPIKRNKR